MYKLSDMLNKLGVKYKKVGQRTTDTFEKILPFSEASEKSLIFFNKYNSDMFSKETSVILLDHSWAKSMITYFDKKDASIFIVRNLMIVVSDMLSIMYPSEDICFEGIHPTAFIHPEARIHQSVSIGPQCYIGKCEIGENSKIYFSTVIKDDSIIGKHVVIREFCFIGGPGFGFSTDRNGYYKRMPHIGNVIIEDYVELFPYVNIDRGTLTKTLIKKGSKIDHYSHIGHNCVIGEHSLIAANTIFSGKSSLGNNSFVGIGTMVKESVAIGSNCLIGMGSVVTSGVDNGWVAYGNPAKWVRRK